jgi:hypothetical protein
VSRRDDHPGIQPSIEIRTDWRPGTRTSVWDALWRQIFAELGDDPDQESGDDEVRAAECRLPTAEPDQDEV